MHIIEPSLELQLVAKILGKTIQEIVDIAIDEFIESKKNKPNFPERANMILDDLKIW